MSKNKLAKEIIARTEGVEYGGEEDRYWADEAQTATPQAELVERLEKLHEEFATEASQLTAQADEAEEQVWRMRASATSLRQAAEGVSRAIKEFRREWDTTTKRLKEREAMRRNEPAGEEDLR